LHTPVKNVKRGAYNKDCIKRANNAHFVKFIFLGAFGLYPVFSITYGEHLKRMFWHGF